MLFPAIDSLSIEKFRSLLFRQEQSPTRIEEVQRELEQNAIELRKGFLRSLNDLIFDGTYCGEALLLDHLKNCISAIDSSKNSARTELENSESQFLYFDIIERRLYDPCRRALQLFIQLVGEIREKYNPKANRQFLKLTQKSNITNIDFGSVYYVEFNYFACNIFVAYCDHFLASGDDHLSEKLDEVVNILSTTTGDGDRLIQKCKFLRRKFTLRSVLKNMNEDVDLWIFRNDGSPVMYDAEESQNSSNFSEWDKHLLDHYELSKTWNYNIRRRIDALSGVEGLTISEYHTKIKFLKDIERIPEGIGNIAQEIEKRINGNISSFDTYALKLTYSYCLNNQLSLLVYLHGKKRTYAEDIELLYAKICSERLIEQHHNYFPQTKYLDFLIIELESFIQPSQNMHVDGSIVFREMKVCEEILNKCQEIITLYEKNVRWVETYYNYVFQLPYNECKIDIDGSPLFVFSSFVLPIDREFLINEFESNKLKVSSYKSALNIYKTTSSLYEGYEKLKEENERKDSKNIEILGLFVAIVTFTAGVIPGFKFIDSGVEAVYFTIALGVSMSLFAITLLCITRKLSLRPLITLAVVVIAVVICLWLIAYRFMEKDYEDEHIKHLIEEKMKYGNSNIAD